MTDLDDPKSVLHRYLTVGRESLLAKLDGLGEYDLRRPLVPTGTNLLGLLKHVASVDVGYFGRCMGRPFPEPLPWHTDDADPNADMWATEEESTDELRALAARAWAHSDRTIEELDLDARGTVPWWGDGGRSVTLHRLLVHMATETHRHAGQADIVRELVDGRVGLRSDNDNVGEPSEGWAAYHARVEQAAQQAARRGG